MSAMITNSNIKETESDSDNSNLEDDDELESIVSQSLDEAYKEINHMSQKENESHTSRLQCKVANYGDHLSNEMVYTIDRSCENNSMNDVATKNLNLCIQDNTTTKQRNIQVRKKSIRLNSGIDMDDLYVNINPAVETTKKMRRLEDLKMTSSNVKVMEKCVMKAGFEKLHEIPPYRETVYQLKKKRRAERDKTKGDDWYNMPAVEMTDERKTDLKLLQMRKAVDPKRFYKSNDLTVLPKYCQFGKIVETAADFYSSRIPRRQRKQTMADELLSDVNFTSFNKRKYNEIQEAKRLGQGPYATRREREKKGAKKRRLKRAKKML